MSMHLNSVLNAVLSLDEYLSDNSKEIMVRLKNPPHRDMHRRMRGNYLIQAAEWKFPPDMKGYLL